MNPNERQNVIKNAAEALKQGKIILYPTDTIWGIGCDATNETSISKVYEIKNRPTDKKLIVLFSSIAMMNLYFDSTMDFSFMNQQKIPTTFILSEPSKLPEILYSLEGIAVRIPRSPWLQNLIESFGKPIISTSANISGDISPKDFYEVSSTIKKCVDFTIPEHLDDGTHRPSQIMEFKLGQLKKVR